MMMNRQFIILIALVMSSFIFGCHRVRKDIPDSMVTGQTTIAADEALLPVMNAEIDVFQSMYNFATVNCKFVSEYDAINLLLQEQIRLALVTRPLNQKELNFFQKKEIRAESILLAYDAIAVIVPSGNSTKVLSMSQISQILSGTIVDWEQLSNSGKTGHIRLIFDAESSGIIRSLNDSLHLNQKISGDIIFAGSNKKVIESVADDPESIGFVGYNWLSENENRKVQDLLKQVNLIAVSRGTGADGTKGIQPTVASLFNLEYPLIRKIYAIYTDPSASLARGFLAHLTSERGRKIIYRMGLKPENDFQRSIKINKDY
jgi:phosphate transport system substrate-binding protein